MAIATSYTLGDRPSERGSRESLDNVIRRVAVEDTPMFSLLPRGPKAQAMMEEWIVDDLDKPRFPGIVDGKALSFSGGFADKTTSRARLENRVQQLERTYAVSPQAQAVNTAGGDLLAVSKSKSLIELKRDMEALICSDTDQSSGTAGAGDKLTGLGKWTDPTNTSRFPDATHQAYRARSGSRYNRTTGGAMSENDFRDLLQAIYEGHGSASSYRLVAGPSVINDISGFTRVEVSNHATFQLTQNVGDGTLKLSVQEYISDWGRVYLVPSLLNGFSTGGTLGNAQRNRGYLIPGDGNIQLRYLEDIKTIDLADVDGGGARGLVRAMVTICPLAGGKPLGSIV
tara:strand:- start:2251 stop:3276 length:1026 start_codon:yes stop_codon:yes gene_type:complete